MNGTTVTISAFTLADHVGDMRVRGGSVCPAPAEDDAEGKGCREVHRPLRLCFRPVQIHQLCTLDSAGELPPFHLPKALIFTAFLHDTFC